MLDMKYGVDGEYVQLLQWRITLGSHAWLVLSIRRIYARKHVRHLIASFFFSLCIYTKSD